MGKVIGPYEFHQGGTVNGHYRHVHPFQWLGRKLKSSLSESTLFSLGSISTIFRPDPTAQAELRAFVGGPQPAPTPLVGDSVPATAEDAVSIDLFADLEAQGVE